jgi:hypothetical protein
VPKRGPFLALHERAQPLPFAVAPTHQVRVDAQGASSLAGLMLAVSVTREIQREMEEEAGGR